MEALVYLSKDFFKKPSQMQLRGRSCLHRKRLRPAVEKKHPCDDIAEEPSQMQLQGRSCLHDYSAIYIIQIPKVNLRTVTWRKPACWRKGTNLSALGKAKTDFGK